MMTILSQSLAILGGEPTFSQPLHVGRPNTGEIERFKSRVDEMLARKWFSNDGPLVREFESRIAEHVGVEHCVAMCNATVAMAIAIRAMEIQGEVILPSYTFVSTAHVLRWQQIKPRFVDVCTATHNIDPEKIESAITPDTSAIIGVHVWGRPCDTDRLEQIAAKHQLHILYDAAHAFSCTHQGKQIGHFGDCEVFSFHATKFLNSFEGGAVVTRNAELAAKLRLMRNFGFAGYDRVVEIGLNGKMSEVCAAMGITSLDSIDQLIAVNRRNYALYKKHLAGIPGLTLIDYAEGQNNCQYIVVELDPSRFPLSRDEMVAVLHAENVLARKYFWPGAHRMQPYATEQPDAANRLERTEEVAGRVIVLPTGQEIDEREISLISTIFRSGVRDATAVRNSLKGSGR